MTDQLETRNVVCSSCDIGCPLVAEVRAGEVVRVRTHDHPALKDYICMKGAIAPNGFRLLICTQN